MDTRYSNRPQSRPRPDDWLTPPEIVEALGPFDLDPACPAGMPWRTAARMVCSVDPIENDFAERGNGLAIDWTGRAWLNPPYSNILPWALKMATHGDGVMLVPARSTDTLWGQTCIGESTSTLFLAGRLLFWQWAEDGGWRRSTGKWAPSMLCAFGAETAAKLAAFDFPGTLMERRGK